MKETAEKKKIDKMAALKGVIKDINKRFGEGVVDTASNMVKDGRLTNVVIPTPSLELNDALGGGFSGTVELFGANSSGKTSLAMDTIAKAQREDPNFVAVWLETEGSVTDKILAMHNVNLDRLIFYRQEDVNNAENALDIIRAFITDGNVNMIVVNSVAGLAPSEEIEDDLSKQKIALTARLLSKFFRVANHGANKNKITMVFINQLRDAVGVMYGDPTTTTGGKALGFYASQRIRMNMLSLQKTDPITSEEGVKIGFSVKKNRFSDRPFKKGDYYAEFVGGISSIVRLPQMLLNNGIVRQAGAYWYYEDANGKTITIDGIEGKFRSKNEFLNVLKTNKKWYDEMMSKVSIKSSEQTEEEKKESEADNKVCESEVAHIDEEIAKEELSADIDSILEGENGATDNK